MLSDVWRGAGVTRVCGKGVNVPEEWPSCDINTLFRDLRESGEGQINLFSGDHSSFLVIPSLQEQKKEKKPCEYA